MYQRRVGLPFRASLATWLVASLAASLATAQIGPQPWPMRYADPARTSQSSFPGADLGLIEWRWPTAGEVPGLATYANGRIVLGVTFNEEYWSGDTYLTTLTSKGRVAWRRQVPAYDWGASQGVSSWPAIDGAGNIIVNSARSQLLKLTPGARPVFRVQRNDGATNDSVPAVLADGTILHFQYFDDGLARYTPQGELVWSTFVSSQSDVAVAPNGDMAMGGVRTIEPHGSTDITYLNADGSIRWTKTSSNGRDSQTVFGPDGTLYQGQGAFNPDGSIKWGFPDAATIALGKNGQHYATGSQSITARNAQTGQVLWTTSLPGHPLGFALDNRDRIYTTTPDGWLLALEPAGGAIVLSKKLAFAFDSPPVISANGRIVAAAREGIFDDFVYQIR